MNIAEWYKVLTIGLLFILVFSCSDPLNNPDIKVFHYNQPNPITSLDPAFAKSQNNIWATHHLFDRLVQLDDQLNVVPSVAKSWSISEDGTVYTFNLRDDIYFHENICFNPNRTRKLTAVDVVYSFNRIISPEVNSPGSWIFKDRVQEDKPFIAYNDTTFILKLSKPFLPMLGILTMQYCSVIPNEAVEYYGTQFRGNPVGSGPFKFKRWLENQGLYLIRNTEYFNRDFLEKSNLDGVRTSFIADRKIAYLELMNQRLEFFSGLESSIINELIDKDGELVPELDDQIHFIKAPYLNMEYFGINIEALEEDSPLRFVEVRQALNYALDRELMLSSLRNNVGKPAHSGFIPRGLPSHNPDSVKGYQYDIIKAQELLAKAGFPNGNGMKPITLYTNKDYIDLTTFAARQWENIGIRVEIELLESAMLRDGMRKGNIPFFRASWIADYPDGESFLCMFYSENPAPPNYTRYKNPIFDRLYDRAISETEIKQRIRLYQQMDRMIIKDAPVVFLFYDETAIFSSKRISGLSKNAMNLLEVKNIVEE